MANQRKILIINRSFQFRFIFFICSWILALSIFYPIVVYQLFDYFLEHLTVHAGNLPPDGVEQTRSEILRLIILVQAAFIGITAIMGMFVSHRIAGPLYKLRKWMLEAKSGKLPGNLKFRKTDYFPELADGYNEMVSGVRSQVDAAISAIEKQNPGKALEILRKLR